MAGHADHRERVKLRVKDRDRLREIIKVEDIITRVQNFAVALRSKLMDNTDLLMTPEQLTAARMLLNKALPDLASVEITPDAEAFTIADEPLSPAEWAAQHTGETVQ